LKQTTFSRAKYMYQRVLEHFAGVDIAQNSFHFFIYKLQAFLQYISAFVGSNLQLTCLINKGHKELLSLLKSISKVHSLCLLHFLLPCLPMNIISKTHNESNLSLDTSTST
jgi:hypothetical protein